MQSTYFFSFSCVYSL